MDAPDVFPAPERFATRRELRALVRLALPVVVVQVGLTSMGLVDTLFVGRVSEQALAGVALGNIATFSLLCFGLGTLMALDPLITQALGAGDHPAVGRAIRRGLVLAVALSVPVSAVLLVVGPILTLLGQPTEIVPIAAAYARVSVLGVPAFFLFVVARQALQAMHLTRAIVVVVVVANVANALLDVALVFGRFGAPRLGAVGSAWATATSRWAMAVGLFVAAWPALRPHVLGGRGPRVPWRRRLAPLAAMLRLGAPIGGQYVLEIGTFTVVAVVMGWLGTRQVASHQVAIGLASFTFMIPMGISAAAGIRVGHAVGRADPAGARRAAGVSLACGGVVMTLCAATFLAIPRPLAALFTNQESVVDLAAKLIRVAGVFQVFDGLQVVAIGVLRGLGDTRTPIVVNLLGFVLVGLPVALLLGLRTSAGAVGLWWGLTVGLVVVAGVLLWRVARRLSRPLSRLEVA